MGRWYRVFGSLDAEPSWIGKGGSILLERYSADEEGIRAELNSWAAYLETCGGPHHVYLMERTIQARHLFTLHDPTKDELDSGCVALCRHLAIETAGFYQIDAIGFFDADGTLLVAES